jgi:hypothetical protein
MIAPAPHPVKVFGALGDATKWIAPHVREVSAHDTKPEMIDDAIDAIRKRFAARAIKAPN